jgi:NADPH-dependent 2,4-dienoyl-CoA reductase/sulfur reductase-like enzyme
MPEAGYDIAIAGAGPAGIAAACTAAECGLRVVLLDDNPSAGGQVWRGARSPWLDRLHASAVDLRIQSQVIDSPEQGALRVVSQNNSYLLRFGRLIIATGARERYLPFPGWTLPGVFGAGGLQALAKSGWPVAGKRIVVAGSGPLLLAAAAALHQRGARIAAIAEQAPRSRVMMFALRSGKLWQGVQLRMQLFGAPYRFGCWPVRAEGSSVLKSVILCRAERTWDEPCDYLACGFGLVPNIELAMMLGCRVHHGAVQVDQHQQTSIAGVYCAGEPAGVGGAELAIVQGRIAGYAAAGQTEKAHALFAERARWTEFRTRLEAAFALRSELKHLATDDTLICRCEDVPLRELRQHDSWRSAKLHARCGMGPCQGRVCGPAVETLFGWRVESVRPPLTPVTAAQFISAEASPSSAQSA